MRLYGLIGKPLSHSFSKRFFTQKFEELHLDCQYENFELDSIEEVEALVAKHDYILGLNVTIPYKESIIPLLHYQSAAVRSIGACNCIKIVDGNLWGYNTDVIGFKISLEKKLKPQHKSALILGTGGAAKAVAFALSLLGISYQFVSRQINERTLNYSSINASLILQNLLIINTTPLGMYPDVNKAPDIPYQFLTPDHFLFDLTYNPDKTLFLLQGEKMGSAISNGYEMLVIQAEESWKIWTCD
ncbi:MAG: shikimate dehydrogenase [Chitinophagaceae bacterium]